MRLSLPNTRRRGFTLVELLVSIGIIMVLAGLIFIGTKRAISGANAAKTSSRMKDLYTSLVLLRDEGVDTGNHNAGSYPPHSGVLDDGQGTPFVWWDLVAEKLNIADREGGRFEWKEPYSETLFQNPLSRKKLGGDRKEYNSLHNSTTDSRGSFAYNGMLGGEADPGADEERAFVVRGSRLQDASNTIFFAESDDNDKGPGWEFSELNSAPQGNYKESAHCCFVDGSVQLIRNAVLKKASAFDFYTAVEDKNYNNQP
ncbi:MAG: type II secretion system protein [Verrucomicrobiaceae bacterium]